MKLYDNTIVKIKELLAGADRLPKAQEWKSSSKEEMVLRSECAYELGGDFQPSLGCTIITADPTLVERDEVSLIGEDLTALKKDAPYARISIVLVDEETLGEGEMLYRAIRDLEYTRYHFFPEGFMLRVSASRGKETVRVSKAAVKGGISFASVGALLHAAFHKNAKVLRVQTCYITDPSFDYAALEKCIKEAEEITGTIDHIMKNVLMDCKSCSLQKICDEVEGMRELHFKKQK